MPNAPYTTFRDDLSIKVVDGNGKVIADPNVQTSLVMGKIEVTPIKEGTSFIRIHRPKGLEFSPKVAHFRAGKVRRDSVEYDLDVRCCVTAEIDSAHIELSATQATVTASDSAVITAKIEGLSNDVIANPDDYVWAFSDGAAALMDWSISGGSETGKGDSIFMTGKGKKSGAAKVTVSHKLAGDLTKSFIVFVKNAAGEAS